MLNSFFSRGVEWSVLGRNKGAGANELGIDALSVDLGSVADVGFAERCSTKDPVKGASPRVSGGVLKPIPGLVPAESIRAAWTGRATRVLLDTLANGDSSLFRRRGTTNDGVGVSKRLGTGALEPLLLRGFGVDGMLHTPRDWTVGVSGLESSQRSMISTSWPKIVSGEKMVCNLGVAREISDRLSGLGFVLPSRHLPHGVLGKDAVSLVNSLSTRAFSVLRVEMSVTKAVTSTMSLAMVQDSSTDLSLWQGVSKSHGSKSHGPRVPSSPISTESKEWSLTGSRTSSPSMLKRGCGG